MDKLQIFAPNRQFRLEFELADKKPHFGISGGPQGGVTWDFAALMIKAVGEGGWDVQLDYDTKPPTRQD